MVRVPDAAAQVRSAPVKALRGFFAGIGQLLITADRFRADEALSEQSPREQAERDQRGKAERDQRGQTSHRPPEHDMDHGADRYESLTAPRGSSTARRGRDNRVGRHRASSSRGPAASAQNPTRRFRSLDSTGNVRLLTSDEGVAEDAVPEDAVLDDAVYDDTAYDDAVDDDTIHDDTSPEGIGPIYGENPVTSIAHGAAPAAVAPLAAARYPAAAAPASGALSAADLPLPGYDQLTLPSLRSRLRYLDIAQLTTLADYEKATANRSEIVGMFERRIAKLQAASGRAT
jgi:hypothetical protein